VSVAANFSLISTGTDTGGSIRFPASFCGVYGLKPTYGSASRYGVVAMASSTDSIGHMARCVDDVNKIYQATKGPDGNDGTLKNLKYDTKNSKLKIGLPKEYFVEGINKDVQKVIDNSIKTLEEGGHKFVDISLPHTEHAVAVYYVVMSAEVSSNLGRYDGIRYGNERSVFGDEAKRRIMLGTYALSAGYYDAYYLKAMKVRTLISKDFERAFKKVDAILTPVSPHPPFKIGEKVNDPLSMYLEDVFMCAASTAGIPGLSVPGGFTKSGLPMGFQLLGPRFSEPVLFSLAKDFEKQSNYSPRVAIK
jgi:aspartyl-tRNA(Asn)/glutamyl-tRNA(Gln) amidotransferase subunit A